MMCAGAQFVLDHVLESIATIPNHQVIHARSATQLLFAHSEYSPVACPTQNLQGATMTVILFTCFCLLFFIPAAAEVWT